MAFLAATMDDQENVPFGEDYSYRDFLLRMFERGEECPKIEEDYSYRDFLLRMFEGGEESPEIEEEEIMDEPSEELEDSDSEVNANVQTNVIEEANPRWNKCTFGYAIAASMICILLGFDIGMISEGTAFVRPTIVWQNLNMDEEHDDFLIGISKLSCLFGSALAGWTSNRIRSRCKIVLAAAFFFVGALLMGIMPKSFFLMLGSLITNIGVGYALTIAPVYIVEISPTLYRGLLTSFPEVFINVGALLGYMSDYCFYMLLSSIVGWRAMLSVGGITLGMLALGVLAIPESPSWLVMQGRLGDAKRTLARISNSEEEAALRLAEIKEAAGIPDDVVEVTGQSTDGMWQELLHRTQSVLHMLACTIGIYLFQQTSGIDTIILYSPRILEKVGIMGHARITQIVMLVELTKTVFSIVATILLDRVGRRKLLLSSLGGMILSLASLGVCLIATDRHWKGKWVMDMCIVSLVCYVASFSIGMGPIAIVYSSEVFPMRLRAQGCAISVAVGQVASGLISMKFMILYRAIRLSGAAFLFMGMAILAWIFLYFLMPETKGRSLEEIEQLFGKWTKWRSSARELELRQSNAIEEGV